MILSKKMNKKENLEKLKEKCLFCTKCPLFCTRMNVVFSDGNENSSMMLVGEAPGANEDMQGLPFVGRSGKLLREFFANEGLVAERDFYISNIIKCRPPDNRLPSKKEKEACIDYLLKQIEIISPQIIVCVGATSVKEILQTKEPISKIRGQWFEGFGAKIMPVFHPSYLLRNPIEKEGSPKDLMRQDIKEIKRMKEFIQGNNF